MQDFQYKKKKKLGSYPFASVILSITLALFVIGLFGLLLLHANNLSRLIQQSVEVQVYLNKFSTENDRIQIQRILSDKDYVLQEEGEAAIAFISKEEAAKKFIEDTGEDIIDFLGENPLRDAYIVKINSTHQHSEQLADIKNELEAINGVFEVTYIENLVDSINQNLTKVSIVLVAFSIILMITVIILINNTIKLALFSQRFLIRSMQLVGAKLSFIKKPFLFRAAFHGLIGGILASGVLYLLLHYGNQKIEDLNKLQKTEEILSLFAILLIIGAFVGFFSTMRAMNRYLNMSLDELY